MRVMGIRVDGEGVEIEWGLMGSVLVRVRVVDGETLVKVNELLRKSVVDEVVEESLSCVQNLSECAGRVAMARGKDVLRDLVIDYMMASDGCVRHEEILEFAEAAGYRREDGEALIKEMIEEGEVEGEGCYELVDRDPLDP